MNTVHLVALRVRKKRDGTQRETMRVKSRWDELD